MSGFRFSSSIFGLTSRDGFAAVCRRAKHGYDAIFAADHLGDAAPSRRRSSPPSSTGSAPWECRGRAGSLDPQVKPHMDAAVQAPVHGRSGGYSWARPASSSARSAASSRARSGAGHRSAPGSPLPRRQQVQQSWSGSSDRARVRMRRASAWSPHCRSRSAGAGVQPDRVVERGEVGQRLAAHLPPANRRSPARTAPSRPAAPRRS